MVAILEGGTGQRTEHIRFDVQDPDGNAADFVCHPTAPGTVTWNPSNRITRTLTGVTFDPTDSARLRAGYHRIAPKWVLSTGDEYPLGVFLYLGGNRKELAGGTWIEAVSMQDRGFQLNQKLAQSFAVPQSSVLTTALAALVATQGITDTNITPSDTTTANLPLVALTGDKTLIDVADELTDLLGYLPSYFDATGTFTARPIPNPADDVADVVYQTSGQNSMVIADSVVRSSTITARPNTFIVRSTAATDAPVGGIYMVPASADNSVENLGFQITDVFDMDGLASSADAVAAAKARAQRSTEVVETVTFDTVPNPIHDAWNIVELDGVPYLEQSWTLDLTPEAKHSHVVSAVYAD